MAVWGERDSGTAASENKKEALDRSELPAQLAATVLEAIQKREHSGLRQAVQSLPDYREGTLDFEVFAIHVAAQQAAMQSDDRLSPHLKSIVDQTVQYFIAGYFEDLESVELDDLQEIGMKRVPAYMDTLASFLSGSMGAAFHVSDAEPFGSLRLFDELSELTLFYKAAFDSLD
jgi:hypothetical protein